MKLEWRERSDGHHLTLSKGETTGIIAAIYLDPQEQAHRVYLVQWGGHPLFLAQYPTLGDAKRAAEGAMMQYAHETLTALRLFVLGRRLS